VVRLVPKIAPTTTCELRSGQQTPSSLGKVITLEDIEIALVSIARIIDRYGDQYWPIFERLEAERDSLLSRQSRLDKYLQAPATPKAYPRKGGQSSKVAPGATLEIHRLRKLAETFCAPSEDT